MSFQEVYDRGKYFYTGQLTFLFLPSDKNDFRISIRKKAGNAPFRNSIKRKIKSLARFFQIPNCRFVIFCKNDIEDNFYFMKEDFVKFWKKVNREKRI